ncbi:caspase domain-containing protein [Nostoc sp. TCL26-01]|uniref:caspase family protein n=1 Tax=Nostoc sp. TCL26-01 TaxID=2576904 RepID=UPI0015C09862|nr:caspase family protein [Nostoc sp. TCL26-01]QLE58860.1 hypothetical protein FD725_27180 [Nostoc sp. TCL26-01]
MAKRRALLIGVPEYDSKNFNALPVVHRDAEILEPVLRKSGFHVELRGLINKDDTLKSNIVKVLKQECNNASKDDILFLYYSGHGIHYENIDYLVPSDVNTDCDIEDFEQSLVRCDLLDNIVDKSKASAIIFFIDACRNKMDLQVKGADNLGWGNSVLKRKFLRVFSCSAGQVSCFLKPEKNDGEYGSLFTKALASILEPEHPSITLQEILDATQEKLDELTEKYFNLERNKQTIAWVREEHVKSDILLFRLKTNSLGDSKSPTENLWYAEVLKSNLWNNHSSDTHVAEYKKSVGEIVNLCWQQWEKAGKAFEQDPWRDERFAIRILKALELLLNSVPSINLSLCEIALIITAPFIYEAVLATGLVKVAESNLDILSIDKNKSLSGGFQIAIEKVNRIQHRIVRKARQFRDKGLTNQCEALKAWLLYRSLLLTPEVWKDDREGYLFKFSRDLFDIHDKSELPGIKTGGFGIVLLNLANSIILEPKSIDKYESPKQIGDSYIKVKILGYLLKLAGLLAIDTRKFSDVLVDNIGVVDKQTSSKEYEITPKGVNENINQIDWMRSGSGYTLKGTCNYPALDFVLREHIEEISTVLDHILQQVEKPEIAELSSLPTRFNAEGLTAAKGSDNRPLYTRPHLSFQLAHHEIRELIMGKQLYGDPSLAIRELYQNALDACRYREARHKYFQQKPPTNYYQESQESWKGKITFRQGKENGRAYIECQDNGIGMESQQLTDCFTCAGRRFADLPEFIEEQVEWLKCNPRVEIYPNSQFGVGVFSYFMLADELEVKTCRLGLDGKPGLILRLFIPGSSGLLRLKPGGNGSDDDLGTTVRLYLNEVEYQDEPISCLKTLKKLLWVAEFSTEVWEDDTLKESWEPGKLQHPDLSDHQIVRAGKSDIWWINYRDNREKGCVLSDGIYTETESELTVINLRKEHLPKLTVDRQKIVDLDLSWVKKELSDGWESLISWEGLTIQWFWQLEVIYLDIAIKVVDYLCRNQASVKLKGDSSWNQRSYYSLSDYPELIGWSYQDTNIPIYKIGICVIDGFIAHFMLKNKKETKLNSYDIKDIKNIAPLWVVLHRIATLHQYGLEIPPFLQETIKAFKAHDQLKVIFPGDEFCFNASAGKEDETERYQSALDILLLGTHKLSESVADMLQRLERFYPLFDLDRLELKKISHIDIETVKDLIPSQEDLRLLSKNLYGQSPWVEETIPLRHIWLAAAKLKKPVEEIYQQLEKFQPLGWKLPQVDSKAVKNLIISEEDLRLLSQSLNGESPWLEEKIPFTHLLVAARKLEKPVGEIHQQLEKFQPLGWKLPQVDSKAVKNLIISEEDLRLLSQSLNGESPWLEEKIPLTHLLVAARKLEKPVGEIHQRLKKFQPLGWKLPQVDSKVVKNLIISEEDLLLLSQYLNGESPWLEEKIPLIHLLEAAANLEKPVAEIRQGLEKFEKLGWQLPPYNSVMEDLIPSQEDLSLLSQSLNGASPWVEDIIPLRNVVIGAARFRKSVGEILQQLEKFQLLGWKIPPNYINISESLIPNQEDLPLLSPYLDVHFFEIEENITSSNIFRAAKRLDKPVADVYEEFKKFQVLGFQLPDINLECAEANSLIPSDNDFILVSKELDSYSDDFYDEKIPAVHLLRVSAKLNRSVGDVFKRSQVLAEVLNLELPPVKLNLLEDWIVSLRDILILSENLNAVEPWIEDSFSLMHVIQFSARFNEPLRETIDYLQKFEAVGFNLPKVDFQLISDNFTPSLKDLIAVSQDLDGIKPWIQGDVTEDHLTKATSKLKESREQILGRLKPFSLLLRFHQPEE